MCSSTRLSLAELCNHPSTSTTSTPTPPHHSHSSPPHPFPPPPPPYPLSSSSSSSPSSSAASSPPSPMSSPDVVHAGIKRPLVIDSEDHDEDVRNAARALGDMRSRAVAHARAPSAEAFAAASKAHSRTSSASHSTPFLSPSTTPSTISNSSPQLRQQSLDKDHYSQEMSSPESTSSPSKDFVSRMVHTPIVSSVINAYEDSKKRSKVVKIGANLMESSVKTISRPVINRLPVNQLDEFACRQLDRIYPIRSPPASPDHAADPPTPKLGSNNNSNNNNNNNVNDNTNFYTAYRDPAPLESGASSRAPSVAPDDYSASNSPTIPIRSLSDDPEKKRKARDDSTVRPSHQPPQQQEIVAKSKWQSMLCEAGGISAAVSQESMKRLQYCLQWLQYATNRIDSQILVLRSFIDSLTPNPPHENDPYAPVPLQVMRTLTDVRRDLVKTIREVVKVISTYAGSALPEPARSTVRTFILRLPARWASATGGGDASNPPSMPSSPRMQQQQRLPSSENLSGLNGYLTQIQTHNGGGPPPPPILSQSQSHTSSRPTAGRATHPTALAATQAAQRVLTLAIESIDMMRGVTNVFKDSLERADAWVERLRIMGIQRHDGASNHLHTLPIPGAGPSASSSNLHNLIPSSSSTSSSSPKGVILSSPRSYSESNLYALYSPSSSVHSMPSHSHLLATTRGASPSASASTTTNMDMGNEDMMAIKKRRKRSTGSGSGINAIINAEENGHRAHNIMGPGDTQNSNDSSSEKSQFGVDFGVGVSQRRRLGRNLEENEDETETETEDGVSMAYRSAGTGTFRRTEEQADGDDISSAGLANEIKANDYDYEYDRDNNDNNNDDDDNDNDDISIDRASIGSRRRNRTNSTDTDDCSEASFYSALTRSMDID